MQIERFAPFLLLFPKIVVIPQDCHFTRILKILKMVTPLCGYTYLKHPRVANSVAIFKIFKIRVRKIYLIERGLQKIFYIETIIISALNFVESAAFSNFVATKQGTDEIPIDTRDS